MLIFIIVFFIEIIKVRSVLFQNGEKQPLELPPPQGPTVTLTEKVYVPVKDHPEVRLLLITCFILSRQRGADFV